MTVDEFLVYYGQNAPQIVWFLGAGASRSARIPTASDITWDLKFRYYCLQEQQDISGYNSSNSVIRTKIQSYMDAQGFPPLGSDDEYSFYFQKLFGDDKESQQRYIKSAIGPEQVSITSGHKILAGLILTGNTRLVFSTNFDEVLEKAYAEVGGAVLPTYHIEGSYAALDALHNETFPFYVKLHGDYKYKSINNLESELQEHDEKLGKCFVGACSRYGIAIVGYSGRDKSVMKSLDAVLETQSPFPKGVFWFKPANTSLSPAVEEFIKKAKAKNINAEIIEMDTFDVLMNRIWLQTPSKPPEISQKISRAGARAADLPMPGIGKSFPLIRLNAFPIMELPSKCLAIETQKTITYLELNELLQTNRSPAIAIAKDGRVLFWGAETEVHNLFRPDSIKTCAEYPLTEISALDKELAVKNFITRALTRSLVRNRKLSPRKHGNHFYVVINPRFASDAQNDPLSRTLGRNGIFGKISAYSETLWVEGIEVKIEQKNNQTYMCLVPTIWIDPIEQRESCKFFIRKRLKLRSNIQYNHCMDAWKQILFGAANSPVILSPFAEDVRYNPQFKISPITAFAYRS